MGLSREAARKGEVIYFRIFAGNGTGAVPYVPFIAAKMPSRVSGRALVIGSLEIGAD